MARIICQVLHRPDRITFIWSQGSAAFAPYRLDGDRAESFRQLSQQAGDLLAQVATRGNTLAGELARIGWQLCQAIFPDEPTAREVQGWLNALRHKNEIASLEIVSDLPGSTPWNIVYEQPPDDAMLSSGQPQAFQPFWGVRYPLTSGRRVSAWRQVQALESPVVLLVADPQLPEDQRSRLADLARDKELQVIESKSSLTAAFQEQPPDFVYFFCRSHPDGFMLGHNVVSLSELRDFVQDNEAEPLVFLNLVRGDGASPTASHFARLLSLGIDGLIANEQPGATADASALGLEFFADFVYGGKPLGAVLSALRGRSGAAGLLLASACPAGLQAVWEEGAPAASSEGVPAGPLPEYPYKPLAAYDREERALFTGRRQDVADFVNRLDRADTRLLILHGTSGCGKASFLHAGVVPYLEDEAVGFQALRDRTSEETAAPEREYPVIAIRAARDVAGQIAEALCAFSSQPYEFTDPNGKTTAVDLPRILRRSVFTTDRDAALSTAVRERGLQDKIQAPGASVSPPPLPMACESDVEEITPAQVWEALQNDIDLLARILSMLTDALPGELVILVEQGEEIFTQATRPADHDRRRLALEMLARVAETPGQYKVIYSLRTEFVGHLLDDMPAHGRIPGAFLLNELGEEAVLEAILLPTVTEPIPYANEVPQEKYRFAYAEDVPQAILKHAREADDGGESLLPRVQAICAQLYDMLDGRSERGIGAADLKVLGKGNLAFQLGALVEKRLAFLPHRADRRKFVDLLQHLYRREAHGVIVRRLVPMSVLAEHWRGSMPFNALVEAAAAENVRLFELHQLLIGGKENLYVSLSQDALAQAAANLTVDRRRAAFGRSKMVDMLWVFIPLLFLVGVLVFVAMRSSGAAGGQETFTKEEVQKFVRETQKRIHDAEALLRQPMYSGRVALADLALQAGDALRARQLLLSQQSSEKSDLRGFEWFYLWRRAVQEERSLFGHQGLITSVAVTPNGKLIASASEDGTVKLWDARGVLQATLEGHKGPVHAVAWSADGKTLAAAGEDKIVRLWEFGPAKEYMVMKKPRAALSGHDAPVLALAFASDNNTLASAGLDKTIIIWMTDVEKKARELKDNTAPVRALAFAPDGKILASAGDDGTVSLWATAAGSKQDLKGHTGPVLALAFSPEGDRLASGGMEPQDNFQVGAIRIWDAKAGKLLSDNMLHATGVLSLAFGPGGKTLFSGGKDNAVRVWDPKTAKLAAALHGHLGWVRTLALSGGMLASGSYDQTVKLWAPGNALVSNVLHGHKDAVCSVAFSANDKIVASAGRDGTVRLWDVERGYEIKTISGLGGPVLAVAFSSGQGPSRLAAGTWNGKGPGQIKVWQLETNKDVVEAKELHTLKAHAGGVSCLAFTSDAATLASGGADQTGILWDVASGKEKHVLKGHKAALRALAFSRNDRVLATAGDDKAIRVWEVDGGKEKFAPLQRHTTPITALAYLKIRGDKADENVLISAGYDQTIRIWREDKSAGMLRGHAGPILALALDIRTGSIFTGAWDQTVKVWDPRPGMEERFTFTGHTGPVRGVALSHDGRTLASVSDDGTVRLWRTAVPGVLGVEH